MRLAGKRAVVTGSTRGIGRAIAERFAAEGCHVVVTGRGADNGREVAGAISEAGGMASFIQADLQTEDAVARLFEQADAVLGGLDILVNNAAATEVIGESDGAIVSIDTQAWDTIIRGAATAVLWTCKQAQPRMIAAGGGSIINISTAIASRGLAGMAGHAASKAAVESLTRTMAVEGAPHKIRANALPLGFIVSSPGHAAMAADPVRGPAIASTHPLGLGRPDDVANVALFLASDEARFITGTIIPVDGGMLSTMPLAQLPPTVAEH